MLEKVRSYEEVRKEDFLEFLGVKQKQELLSYADSLRGKKVVHVNATAQGGGVAELLKSAIPYMRALGVDASWYAIDSDKASKPFFIFTNQLHNAIQGSNAEFSNEDWERYEHVNKQIAKDLAYIDYDILVVHDPQPLACIRFLQKKKPAVCVIHIDSSNPNAGAWKHIEESIRCYSRYIFSSRDFANANLAEQKIRVFAPAIDPLAPKQDIMSQERAREYLSGFGVLPEGPLLVQVSRFDVWKNPHGVVKAFWLLEKKYPKAQLALVGFQEARDNPQAEKVYMDVRAIVGKNSRIFLFFDPRIIGGVEHILRFTVMAQNAADIIIQNSVKEGFGLTVTEAMWKEKPVIGGPGAGIRKQILHGINGYIAENTKELAECMDYMVSHVGEADRMAKAGKESVRDYFLMPRYVLDHFRVYNDVI